MPYIEEIVEHQVQYTMLMEKFCRYVQGSGHNLNDAHALLNLVWCRVLIEKQNENEAEVPK